MTLLSLVLAEGVIPAPALADKVRARLDVLRRTQALKAGEGEEALLLTALLGIRLPPSGLLRALVWSFDCQEGPSLVRPRERDAVLQAQVQALLPSILAALLPSPKEEAKAQRGWWTPSHGAEGGREARVAEAGSGAEQLGGLGGVREAEVGPALLAGLSVAAAVQTVAQLQWPCSVPLMGLRAQVQPSAATLSRAMKLVAAGLR
ncbi:hypothetical protein HaLaN_00810, partial [Haematococcus lacustris]